jgi:hypothetical protein
MTRRATIVVLTHQQWGLDPHMTLARIARQHWEEQGHRIVVHRGCGVPASGDIAVQHVDLTRLPAEYGDLARHCPRTINGAVQDISKRRFSRGSLRRGDGYDGPVIVKTDRNHTGMAERYTALAEGGAPARLREWIVERLPLWLSGRLPDDRYPVFERAGDVPGWIWRTSGLIVQKLFVERRGPYYALHQWYFRGDRDCVSTFLSHDPLVQMATVAEKLPLHAEVPAAIRRQREALGFDFGKFDFIVHEGEAILLDANRTPNEGADGYNARVDAILAALAGGLDGLLPNGAMVPHS